LVIVESGRTFTPPPTTSPWGLWRHPTGTHEETRENPNPNPFNSTLDLEEGILLRSQAVLVVTSTRALQRGRPTKPKPPMAVRFVATEILSLADGLSARRA
jgi:hypothetical protein